MIDEHQSSERCPALEKLQHDRVGLAQLANYIASAEVDMKAMKHLWRGDKAPVMTRLPNTDSQRSKRSMNYIESACLRSRILRREGMVREP